MDYQSARDNMVTNQLRCWDVSDPAVLAAMSTVNRERFAPEPLAAFAYCDQPLALGETAQMLAPQIQGRLLQTVAIQPGDRVLDVGSGSGYLAAVMAALGAQVVSVEIDPDLASVARSNLLAEGVAGVNIEQGDAAQGWHGGPFDVIVVTAAVSEDGDCFAKDLKIGGRLFMFVGTAPVVKARLVRRVAEDEWLSEELFETAVEPLVNRVEAEAFEF